MTGAALEGGFADAPIDAARAFRAAMTAMARPGAIERVEGAAPPPPISPAAGALLLTLCDRETPLYLAGAADAPAVREWVAFHIGAPLTGPEAAMFAVGTWAALTPLAPYQIGTPEYPDRSASLIVEMEGLAPAGARLTGPGIKDQAALSLPDIAPFQMNAAAFPLGLDFWLCAGDQVAALPRTTKVEAA